MELMVTRYVVSGTAFGGGGRAPEANVADIQTIGATGSGCSSISALGDGRFAVPIDGAGTCHISIVFRSAAPEFDSDVPFAPCSGAPCCAACGPQAPYAVSVPEAEGEAEGGGAAAAAGDHG